MLQQLTTIGVLLALAGIGPLGPSGLRAQSGKDLGEPVLKSRDLDRLQKALQEWFEAETKIGEISNSEDADSRRSRRLIGKLVGDARKARVEFLERIEDKPEALASVPDLLAIFDGCFPYPSPFSDGKIKREYGDEKAKTGAFFMRRPKGYKPNRDWPLVVSLVDRQNGDPEKFLESVWPDSSDFAKETLFAAPELPGDLDLSPVVDIRSTRDLEAEGPRRSWFFGVLAGLFQGYRLDTDRLYLDATGSSTPFAMRFVSLFPDRFGGLIVRDPQGVENLAAENIHLVPILVIGKSGDENVEALRKKLEEAKHPSFTVLEAEGEAPYADMTEKVIDWAKGAARNLFSKRVQLVPASDRYRKGYWVEIQEGSYLNQVAADQRPMVVATADREANRIEIEARNVTSIVLYLSDALVDLDKEISLVINGKVFQEKRSRSARRLAERVIKRGDSRFVFVADGIFSVPKPEQPKTGEGDGAGNGAGNGGAGDKGDSGEER